jgi:nitrogen PTS system EIIA component
MAWFQKKDPGQGAARPNQPQAVSIPELLDAKAILFPAAGADKAAVLEQLVKAACAAHGLGDAEAYLARVREREEGISTTLDTGLSLPHARVDGLEDVAAALAVCPQGLRDPKQPDVPVRAMFLFFSPNRQDAFTRHLQVLRGVSTLFQPAVIEALCGLKTPAEVLALLSAKRG